MKIALCIPCHGDTKTKFTQCIIAMVACTLGARIEDDNNDPIKIEFEVFIVSGSLLPESRNRLVAEAIHWEADYMLWMDADHVFPSDALLRLLARNKLVVGCNYARRFSPTSPTASKLVDGKTELVWTEEGMDIEEVAHLGLGFCLVNMRVYDILEARAAKAKKKHFWPLFRMDPGPSGITFIGEDVHYFKMLRAAGVPIFCDHALSWEVGHETSHILTNAHAVVQRPKFQEWTKHKLDKFKGK